MLLSFCGRRLCRNGLKMDVSTHCVVSTCVFRQHSTSTSAEEKQTLVSDDGNGIRRIILNNVKKRNALSFSMLNELKTILTESGANNKVKVIIIGHSGSVFSAGHDLKELRSSTGTPFHKEIFKRCTEVMNLVQDIPQPVIAEVKGVATAAGCQLVSTCDLAVSSHNSKFSVPGISIGLFCSTPAVALARSVNRKQALKMLYTGDPIDAQEALTSGLVNEVVPDEEVENATQQLAERITRHSRTVIGLGKQSFYKQINEPRDSAYCLAESCMVDNLQYDDAQEGISAFFEKRKPQWKSEE